MAKTLCIMLLFILMIPLACAPEGNFKYEVPELAYSYFDGEFTYVQKGLVGEASIPDIEAMMFPTQEIGLVRMVLQEIYDQVDEGMEGRCLAFTNVVTDTIWLKKSPQKWPAYAFMVQTLGFSLFWLAKPPEISLENLTLRTDLIELDNCPGILNPEPEEIEEDENEDLEEVSLEFPSGEKIFLANQSGKNQFESYIHQQIWVNSLES